MQTFKQRRPPVRGHISFGWVPPGAWSNAPVLIVGSGPSLKGFDLRRLYGVGYIIAVNGAMLDFPLADAWITLDAVFIRDNQEFLQGGGPPLFIGAPQDDWVGEAPWPPKIER